MRSPRPARRASFEARLSVLGLVLGPAFCVGLAACAEDSAAAEDTSPETQVEAETAVAASTRWSADERAGEIDALRTLVDRNENEAALERLDPLLATYPEDGVLHTLACEAALFSGDGERATALGERAIELSPDSWEAHLQYSRALGFAMQEGGLLSAMGTIGSYKSELRRARELAPTAVDPRADEIMFLLIAPGIAGGDKQRALELAEELVELDRAKGLTMQAWALAENDDAQAALELCQGALMQDLYVPRLRTTYARLLVEDEQIDEAIAVLEAACGDAPPPDASYDVHRDHFDALYQAAKLRIVEERDPERALAHLTRYAEDAPKDRELPSRAAAWWRQGNVHELLDDPTAARSAYETSLDLDPEFEEAIEALDALGN